MDSTEQSAQPSVDSTSVSPGVTLDPARAAAAQSAEAILDDLRHVVGRLPHDDWPEMATAVLEHHNPPIAEALLGSDHIGLQTACRDALEALADSDYVRAKSSIEQIRRYELRLGLQLEDIRSEDPA